MSSRSLIAYLAGLLVCLAGLAIPVVAKPPDLPVKVEVDCRSAPAQMVTRVHPVADLVIPIEKNPSLTINMSREEETAPPSKPAAAAVTAPAASAVAPLYAEPAECASPCVYPKSSYSDSPCTSPSRPTPPQNTQEDQLIKLIVDTIDPAGWSQRGGQATVEYFPLGMALVVNQTPAVQEQIADFLAALRRLQDAQVVVEMRLVTVPDSICERVGIDFNALRLPSVQTAAPQPCPAHGQPCPCPVSAPQAFRPFGFINQFAASQAPEAGVAFLDDAAVFAFMEASQGDPHTSVMAVPKMTVFNGQASTIRMMDNQFFVTSVKTVQGEHGATVFVPQNEPIATGLELSVQPTIAADRRFVRLELKVKQTNIDPVVPLYPVTTMITPIFEGGAIGQPVPFTQYLQQPKTNTLELQRALTVPDGGTVLLGGLKKACPKPTNESQPILSKVPYLNRLFKNVGYAPENEQLLIMVTPRIVINEEEEARQVPGSRPVICPPMVVAAPPAPGCPVTVATRPAAPGCPLPYLPTPLPAPAAVCPMPCPPSAVPQPADVSDSDIVLLARTILEEQARRHKAKKMYRKAEHYRHKGNTEAAQHAYEEVKDLFPDTVFAQAAARHLREIQPKVAMREKAGGTEEQEEPCCSRGGDPSCCCADAASQKRAAKLVASYHQACAEGRLAEAQKLAAKALELNPACFSIIAKPRGD
jgi:hypothetical protein